MDDMQAAFDQTETLGPAATSPSDRDIRATLRATISSVAGDEADAIILFGSRARGDARPDSDWDVMVLTKDNANVSQLRVALQRALCDKAVELGIRVQPLVMRWSEIHDNAALMRNVADEGMPL